jgi:hypothetical protein
MLPLALPVFRPQAFQEVEILDYVRAQGHD